MELMEFRFHEKAKKNGCYVVSAAGFDSIPADLGVLYTMQQFQPPALPSSVTSFLSFQIGKSGMVGTHFTSACILDYQIFASIKVYQKLFSCASGMFSLHHQLALHAMQQVLKFLLRASDKGIKLAHTVYRLV